MAKGSNPVDAHVGARLKLRRTLMGMSQETLGAAVGLTFQQIQKYEKGANRISAGRLFQFAQLLDVPPSFFFDDMPAQLGKVPAHGPSIGSAESVPPPERDPFVKRETLELVRAYFKIDSHNVRKSVVELLRSVGAIEPPASGE